MKRSTLRGLAAIGFAAVMFGALSEAPGSITLSSRTGYRKSAPAAAPKATTASVSGVTTVGTSSLVASALTVPVTSVTTPEPGTLVVWSGLALAGMAYAYRRRTRSA